MSLPHYALRFLINLHIIDQFDVPIACEFVKTNRRFNVDLDLVELLNSEEDDHLTFCVES